jgi:hypothetical protein
LSADLDAIGEAQTLGIDKHSSLLFKKDASGSTSAWASLSKRTAEYRKEEMKKMGFLQEDQQEE